MTNQKKRTRKAKTVAAKTFEQVVLEAFQATGELTGLGALADHCDETDRAEFATVLRAVMDGKTDPDAVRFFLANTNSIRNVGAPSLANWFTGAAHFADVEAWFDGLEDEGTAEVEWMVDEDADTSWMDEDEEPRELYGCIVRVRTEREDIEVESLWSIDLLRSPFHSDRDPYCRIVEAELKAELRARLA